MVDLVGIPPIDIPGATEPDYIDVRGLKTAYRRYGEGEPLVFLHGMGSSNAWLEHHRLFSTRFDFIAPQHPGYGKTPRPAWYRTLDDYVPHYADLLDALGVTSAHIVGHSFGGLVAGAFASVYPERVRSLSIVAPLPLPVVHTSEHDHNAPPPSNLMEMLFNDDAEEFWEYDPPEDLGLYLGEADDEFSEPDAWTYQPSGGLYRRLARVTAPRQIVVPDKDQTVPESGFGEWARWLNAPIVRIPSTTRPGHPSAHMLNVQEPAAFVDQITEFARAASNSAK